MNGKALSATPANIRYAERLVAEIKERIRLGTYRAADYWADAGDVGAPATLEAIIDGWLSAQRIEKSTRDGYDSAARFWFAALGGDRPARQIKHGDILRVLASRPELSGKTVNNYVVVLRRSFELALRDGVVADNPTAGMEPAAWQREPPDPFDRDEVEAIIGYAAEHYPPQVANAFDFWAWTGLRTSELFGLRWASVDLRKRQVEIREASVRGEIKSRTKTNTTRTVSLNSRAEAALKRQRLHTGLGEFVFNDPRYDQPWTDERALRRSYWKPALRGLGIRYRRPYNLRHSYATAMLMAGMTPAFAARQMGHSVEMFLRTYARWIDGGQNDLEMGRLEATISPGVAQKQNSAV